MKPKTHRTGSEGVFYVVPFPMGWRLMPASLDRQTERSQVILWEQTVVDLLVKDWVAERVVKELGKVSIGSWRVTYRNKMTKTLENGLRSKLLPLVHAFPRGRIVRHGRKYQVLHGDNIEEFTQIDRPAIEEMFGIEGRAVWQFDEHEQCLIAEQKIARGLFRLTDDWKAV